MSSKKLLHFLVAMLVLPVLTFAQNTTGSLTGIVKADNGEVLVGATVSVLHVPTGTVYKVQSRKSGAFDISNMQPGGPYTISVSYVNYQTEKRDDIYINLGDAARVDVVLYNKAEYWSTAYQIQGRAVKTATQSSAVSQSVWDHSHT
jgi:hypothetical protein